MKINKKDSKLPVLTFLAVLFTLTLTFATVEAPRIIRYIISFFFDIPDLNPAIEPELIEEFISSNYLRPIGYACLAVVIA